MNHNLMAIKAMMLERAADKQKALDAIRQERLNLHCANMVRTIRSEAGYSQKQLAEMIGTSQSAIARIENFEYGGRTLTMLQRIADALGYTLDISISRMESQTDIEDDAGYDSNDDSCPDYSGGEEVDPYANNFAFAA